MFIVKRAGMQKLDYAQGIRKFRDLRLHILLPLRPAIILDRMTRPEVLKS